MILLDTHVAIWVATNDKALGSRSRSLLRNLPEETEIAISAISFWEISLLIHRRRFVSAKSARELRAELLATRVIEIPLSGPIAVAAVELERLHGDPADRFIIATAIAHEAILMTADRAMLRWRHPLKRQNASN